MPTEKNTTPIIFDVGKCERIDTALDGGMRTQWRSVVTRRDTGQIAFVIVGENMEVYQHNKRLFIDAITAAGGLASWWERLEVA